MPPGEKRERVGSGDETRVAYRERWKTATAKVGGITQNIDLVGYAGFLEKYVSLSSCR